MHVQRELPIGGHVDGTAERGVLQFFPCHQHVQAVILHQENAEVVGELMHGQRTFRSGVRHWKGGWVRHDEGERAAFARFAFNRYGAALHVYQAFADGQAQPRAAVLAGVVAFGLHEILEHVCQPVCGDADPRVRDGEAQHHGIGQLLLHIQRHVYGTALGELDRVAHQVHQHLVQAHGITHYGGGHIRSYIGTDLQSLLFRAVVQHIHHAVQHRTRFHAHLLQFQFSGFDLAQVQDLIHHAQQGFAAAGNGIEVGLLCRRVLVAQQARAHAHDGVHRRADLVAHVGQELLLHAFAVLGALALCIGFILLPVQLRGALGHGAFQQCALPLQPGRAQADVGEDAPGKQGHVEHPCPPGAPPWRQHREPECRALRVPYAITVAPHHAEGVAAGI